MIIDLILDRKDGVEYSPRKFYNEVTNYLNLDIAEALDNGTEEDVKRELCFYIIEGGYNPDLCEYINSVNWL